MTFIETPKNKKEEAVLKAFLTSLSIGFHSEAEEDAALYKAMQKGRRTPFLNKEQKAAFINRLKRSNEI